MNLVILALVGIVTALALHLLGIARPVWTFVGAALLLGATGFVAQGARHQPGQPVSATTAPIVLDPGMVAFRGAVFEPGPRDILALASADGRLAAGETQAAALGLVRDLAQHRDDPILWSDLGYVLALHDRAVSPAAKFAFRRAIALAPATPGPAFFLGMAYVDAGNLAAARVAWARALGVTPRTAPYRADIVERLDAIDQFDRMAAAQRGDRAPGRAAITPDPLNETAR
jgi:cytochrome c-type biogenesis protein CcmH